MPIRPPNAQAAERDVRIAEEGLRYPPNKEAIPKPTIVDHVVDFAMSVMGAPGIEALPAVGGVIAGPARVIGKTGTQDILTRLTRKRIAESVKNEIYLLRGYGAVREAAAGIPRSETLKSSRQVGKNWLENYSKNMGDVAEHELKFLINSVKDDALSFSEKGMRIGPRVPGNPTESIRKVLQSNGMKIQKEEANALARYWKFKDPQSFAGIFGE